MPKICWLLENAICLSVEQSNINQTGVEEWLGSRDGPCWADQNRWFWDLKKKKSAISSSSKEKHFNRLNNNWTDISARFPVFSLCLNFLNPSSYLVCVHLLCVEGFLICRYWTGWGVLGWHPLSLKNIELDFETLVIFITLIKQITERNSDRSISQQGPYTEW